MKKKLITFVFILILSWLPKYGMQVEFPQIQAIGYFPYTETTVLEKKGVSLSLGMYYSNIYMFQWDGDTINDMEMFSNTLSFRYGLSDSLTLEMYYRFFLIHGGFMDRFVMNFHSTFGLPSDAREVFPLNSIHYKYKDKFFYRDSSVNASPLVIGIAAKLLDRGDFSLLGRLSLGIPLIPKDGYSSEKPFLNAGLAFNYKSGIFSLEGSGYLSFFKAPEYLEAEALRFQIFSSEIKLGIKKFFTGFVFRTSPFKEGDLAHNAYQISLGYKITKWLEFAIVEDFAPFDTTPDFSFNLRIKLIDK